MLGEGLIDYVPPVTLKVQAEQNSQGDSARESHRHIYRLGRPPIYATPLELVQLLNGSAEIPLCLLQVFQLVALVVGSCYVFHNIAKVIA
jgi:hypothetical protein